MEFNIDSLDLGDKNWLLKFGEGQEITKIKVLISKI